MGQTPGLNPGETVGLLIGDIQTFTLQDGFAYLITVECVAVGIIGTQVAQAFVQSYCLMQVAGVPTIEGTGPVVPSFGSAAASSWTLTAAISSPAVVLTFNTGATTAACNLNCTVRISKVGT
jgi:hypothetical protein